MARLARRLAANVGGDFYVDDTCIDCATCRWMAPETFDRRSGQSRVHAQPASDGGVLRALQALVACPTASIGTAERHDLAPVRDSFPRPIDGPVHHCGYHAESSFGAASYLLVREAGNVLVDSPRFTRPLVKRIEELGGVDVLFLTHKDDVADHDRFRRHFGCRRVLHEADLTHGTREVEIVLTGVDPHPLADDLLALPVPGHTEGSACLLAGDYLLSGDHVAWSPDLEHVYAFRSACWYDWSTQIESMRRLLDHRFTWILPGHGWPCHLSAERMREELQACIEWMLRGR